MNKQRKTSHILNVFQYDDDGHVVLPASLTLTIAPGSEDNNSKVPTTAWVRALISGLGYVTLASDQTITGLKTIVRVGASVDVLNFKIGTDTIYGLKVAYNQNELVESGEATWSLVNTFNRNGTGFSVTPVSFFRGVLVTGERLLSASVNANLLDYYSNNPSGRYPVYAYNTGVQQFSTGIIVGKTTGVVNAATGAISDLPSGVVGNFGGRVIGSNAVNSNEFVTLTQLDSYVPTSRTLTINGTTFDLSANRTWTIPAGVTSFNTRTGAITLSLGDVTGALGYTPYNNTNPSGYITSSGSISGNAGSVTYLMNRTDSAAYPVLWGANYTNGIGTIAYSCAAVTIQSSTGTLTATTFSGALSGNATTATAAQNSSFLTQANATWGARIQLGGNGDPGSIANLAVVQATDGNLHMDSGTGKSMYLNYYRNGIIYLNGATYFISANGSQYNGNSATATTSSQVSINYNNDSNSTYQLLWGSGNSVYGSAQVYVNPSSDIIYARGGYISPSNAWGTSDSAFFPNGITTAGTTNWIYGSTTHIGNATGNGAGHDFYSSGSSYSTGNLETNGSFRAPIFYDRNDTGYYLDPTSASSLRTVGSWRSDSAGWDGEFNGKIQYHSNSWYFQAAGSWLFRNSGGANIFTVDQAGNTTTSGLIRIAANTNLYLDNNYGQSIVGVYASTRYQGIFAMGDAYKLAIDGTSTGSLYGLAWSHPNAGGVAGNLNTHGLLVMEAGGFLAAISGSIRARDDMRAPIFYDSNNTGYYVDAASTSYLYDLTLGGSKHTYLYINPGNGYEAMVRYNGGSGSGWYGGKRTSGGINSTADFHFYSEAAGADVFGISTGGTAISSGDMRSPIFYDSNNTGFYLDPNNTSKLSTLNVNNLNSGNVINVGSTNNGNESIATTSARGLELHSAGDRSYWIGKREGAWTQPLDVAFYTGIRYHAHQAYNGHRFFTTGYDSTESFSIGNGDNNVRVANTLFVSGDARSPIFYDQNDTGYYLNPNGLSYLDRLELAGSAYFRPRSWIQFDSNYGLYWPNNYGAHLYPNNYNSYTQFRLDGNKNGYGGIVDSHSAVSGIMYDSGGNGGVYREANSRWYFYYHLGNDCMGVGTSSTSSTYSLYLNKGIYAPSRIDATIFYDASNTGYYLDPNGGSYLAGSLEVANGYFLTNGIGGSMYMTSVSGSFGGYLRTSGHMVLDQMNAGYNVYVLDGNSVGVVKNAGSQSWSAFSDKTIKTIHSVMENNLSKLESITPIYYSFNNFADDKNRIGLIAQEVQEHFPELVEVEPMTEKLVLDYTGLIPVLLGAIKELKNKVEVLESQL